MPPPEGDALALHAMERGYALLGSRQLAQAEACFRDAVALRPDLPEARNGLGIALCELGRPEEAEASFRSAIELRPGFADAHNNRGIALRALRRLEEAVASFRVALGLKADFAEACNNLGITLLNLRRPAEAEQACRRALELAPGYANAHSNLGAVMLETQRLAEAEQSFRAAVSLAPAAAGAQRDLGVVLARTERLEEAEACYRRALALEPRFAEAHDSLGYLLAFTGRLEEGMQHIRKALACRPDFPEAHSRLAFLLNYVPGLPPAEIFAVHREFDRRFGNVPAPAHANAPDPERRLRLGYVSGDFRSHAVASFIEPVLARHDADRFEVFCYYNFASSDPVTLRLKRYPRHWRDVVALDDGALAALVRSDAIDVLVDLSGHTVGNRLCAVARKPAPVQATWLGYLNTTGLDAVDFRITDPRATPEGPLEAYHSEKLIRLPDSQWCYQPPAHGPEVNALPCNGSGIVTFAAFTGPAKTGRPVIELWSRLLARVPRSRLLVQIGGFGSVPGHYAERFAAAGIARDRVDFIPNLRISEYFALRHAVDIVLDTFPCTGGTTTCDSLWMGVPVVTLSGDTPYSRGGASLLHAVGLDELIARSEEEYLSIAARLAADRERLAGLRARLREQMRRSPLMDAERFTRNLEHAYRTMWREWCERQRA